MKVKNPVSQNIRIFPKINQKKDLPTEKFKFFKVCSFMHSILGRGSFSTKIPASVRCGMEAISLWHCWGTIEPSARLYCWIDCFSSFSWKYPIDSIWGSSSNIIVISWSANHFEVILGWRHKVLQNLLVDVCIDFKQLGCCASPVFLQTPDLDFQMKCKWYYFYLKRGLWTTEQQSSSFSPQPR